MRERLEQYIIWLNKDLQLSKVCQSACDSMLSSLGGNEQFSPLLSKYFIQGSSGVPYPVLANDPSQVAVLKKTINALSSAKIAFERLENIDIKSDRYTVGITKDVARGLYKSVHELYAVVQILNHSSAEVQNIVGPHLSALMPKLSQASESLAAFTPDNFSKLVGMAKDVVVTLPSNPPTTHSDTDATDHGLDNFSAMIAVLPAFFENLQKLIATGASGMTLKAMTSTVEYQEMMLERATQIKKQFEGLVAGTSLLSTIPSYLSIVTSLAKESSDLVSTAAPLTKQAYLDAADKLNKIRHDELPRLVAELEHLEESLCLKPNLLVGPVVEKMESCYQQLANSVDRIAKSAGVIQGFVESTHAGLTPLGFGLLGASVPRLEDKLTSIEGLNILRDDVYVERVQHAQRRRLAQEKTLAADDSKLKAATLFFKKISDLNWMMHKWTLANATPEVKAELANLYKQFQDDFAMLHPEIDSLIVKSLAKENDGSILKRIVYTDYRGLGYSNPIKTIADCKESVLANLNQSLAQAAFNAQIIEVATMQRADSFYTAQQKTTQLTTEVAPFKLYDFQFTQGLSVEHYMKQKNDVVVQRLGVESGLVGNHAFCDYLSEISEHLSDDTDINQLNDTEKEILRHAYKTFQPHVILLDQALDKQIVDALNSSKQGDTLFLGDLKQRITPIEAHLNETLIRLNTYANDYVQLEQSTRKISHASKILTPRGVECEKKTLFGQVASLKLSSKVTEFIESGFKTFLSTHLSEEDAKKLTLAKLPFTEFYKDTSEIIMYKEMMNSLYHLNQSLLKLETMGKEGSSNYILGRGRYAWGFLSVIRDVAHARYFLVQAAQNPGFSAVLAEANRVLAPLKELPMVGDYFKVTGDQEQTDVDMLTQWETQQALLKSVHTPSSVALEEDEFEDAQERFEEDEDEFFDAPESPSDANEDTLSQVARILYALPERLRGIKKQGNETHVVGDTQDQILQDKSSALVNRLKGLSYGPQSLQKLLQAVKEVDKQCSEIGSASLETLKELPRILGENILSVADSMEFHLGLNKPGELSLALMNQSTLLYESLIESIAFKKDQDGLRFINKTPEIIVARLAKENERLAQLNENKATHREKTITSVGGRFALLKSLKGKEKELDFQKKFFEYFQRIQPELAQIDYRYSRNNFYLSFLLRELSTPAKFTKELKAILALEPKLNALVDANIRKLDKEITRSTSRVQALNHLLKQAQANASDKVEVFKEKVFDQYLAANIRSRFEPDLGGYTDSFMTHLDSLFNDRKAQILQDITLEDDIESVIATRMDAALTEMKRSYQTIQLLYQSLNRSYKTIHQSIDVDLSSINPNPWSNGRLSEVRDAEQRLLEKDHPDALRLQQALKEAKDYEFITTLYAKLDDLKAYVLSNKDGVTDIQKVNEIHSLQDMLTDTQVTPSDRINNIRSRGLSDESHKILTQNSDWAFIKLLKSFWSLLTGWQSTNDKKVSMFRSELQQLRENDVDAETNVAAEDTDESEHPRSQT